MLVDVSCCCLRISTLCANLVAGINLASVSAVVHATMPRSLEEYVQQASRARGGRVAA